MVRLYPGKLRPGDTATTSWFPHLQNFLSFPLSNQISWYLILSNQTEAMRALDINIVTYSWHTATIAPSGLHLLKTLFEFLCLTVTSLFGIPYHFLSQHAFSNRNIAGCMCKILFLWIQFFLDKFFRFYIYFRHFANTLSKFLLKIIFLAPWDALVHVRGF